MLKKLIEAVKDLVTEANFDCSATGIALQAMDSSHVSLVAMQLKADGFEHYRCDRDMSIGMNMASLSKILKCANNDDVITIKAEDVSNPPFACTTLLLSVVPAQSSKWPRTRSLLLGPLVDAGCWPSGRRGRHLYVRVPQPREDL